MRDGSRTSICPAGTGNLVRDMPTLSIITPTFNRAAYLERCYRSLESQTNHDFEWILVDDGSTDQTADVVKDFQSGQFNIQFLRKENGGKHTALNAAHPYITGRYVLILDSDDALTSSAVQTVLDAWAKFDQNPGIGIVTFLKGTDEAHPVCEVADYGVPVDIMRYPRIRHIRTDCCEVIRAELFKKYPFPVFEGERFLSESVLWDQVSFTHKCVYQHEVIYLCEYLEGGLTKSGRALRLRNPRGGMFTSNLRMDRKNSLKGRIKNGFLYTCYGKCAGVSLKEIVRNSRAPALAVICMPWGNALRFLWNRRSK